MRKSLFRLIILIVSISIVYLGKNTTGAFFTASTSSVENSISSGCWSAPSVPVLKFPADNTHAGLNSEWDRNPREEWNASSSNCPLATTIEYQYETYSDSGLTHLLYTSAWLTATMIPSPGTPDGTYYWHVRARDSRGNASIYSDPWSLTVDRLAPVISNVHVNSITSSSADISWDTNEGATSNIDFGLTSAYGQSAAASPDSLVLHHSISLSGLTAATVYHFKVTSKDEAENSASSTDATFTTLNPPVLSGDVVINEIMWSGSYLKKDDTWIELRNKTDREIDLSNWQITYLKRVWNPHTQGYDILYYNLLTIPSGYKISSNGFFLITRNNEPSSYINVLPDIVVNGVEQQNLDDALSDRAYFQLKLYKGESTNSANLIDTANDGNAPFAGIENANPLPGQPSGDEHYHRSMERNDNPKDGTIATNWHTCEDYSDAEKLYWDSGNGAKYNQGTPGHQNLSEIPLIPVTPHIDSADEPSQANESIETITHIVILEPQEVSDSASIDVKDSPEASGSAAENQQSSESAELNPSTSQETSPSASL